MDLASLAGTDLGSHLVDFDDRTTILYALCAGADPGTLDLVWERRLRALPSLATALGLWAVEAAGDLGAYDRTRSLHVGQRLRMRGELPATGPLPMSARVDAVWDKGRAAIVEIVAECDVVELGYTIFLPGMGGFGGPSAPPGVDEAEFVPELAVDVATDRRLALFYRLTGDRHPIHVDPATATANGFEQPILHGLCTLAIAAATTASATGADPCRLTDLEARFAAPVTPGETITVQVQPEADGVRFAAAVGDRVVLRNGSARFA